MSAGTEWINEFTSTTRVDAHIPAESAEETCRKVQLWAEADATIDRLRNSPLIAH